MMVTVMILAVLGITVAQVYHIANDMKLGK